MKVTKEALVIVGAVLNVGALGGLKDAVQRVMGEVTLRATGDLADESDRLKLVEEVRRGLVDMDHPVDRLARRFLASGHQSGVLWLVRKVVGHANARDARREQRLVRDARNGVSVDEHPRLVSTQGLSVVSSAHQHGTAP